MRLVVTDVTDSFTQQRFRFLTLDMIRMEIASRCDALVGRQRRGYSARRAEKIKEMQASYDALTRAIHPSSGKAKLGY